MGSRGKLRFTSVPSPRPRLGRANGTTGLFSTGQLLKFCGAARRQPLILLELSFTLICMIRKRVKPVKVSRKKAAMDVLIACDSQDMAGGVDGLASLDGFGVGVFIANGPLYVREVTPEDAKKWARTEFASKTDHVLLTGVAQIKRGYDDWDNATIADAFKRLGIPLANRMWSGQAADTPFTLPLPADPREHGRIAYSQFVSAELESVRVVVRFRNGEFRPAIYCPNKKTAVWYSFFTEALRVCPECKKPFSPKAGNVDYCCAAHRENHRVKRWQAARRASAAASKATSNEAAKAAARPAKGRSETRVR